jgi:hypothetical protein
MATGFVTRLRSRYLRILLSPALTHVRTLQTRSGSHSRPNTASLVQVVLSSLPTIRSPFLIDRWLLKVPLLIGCNEQPEQPARTLEPRQASRRKGDELTPSASPVPSIPYCRARRTLDPVTYSTAINAKYNQGLLTVARNQDLCYT